MRLVLDASVTLSLALPDEKELGDIVLSELKNGQALVPALWWYEVRNALIISERRRRLTVSETSAVLQALARLPILMDRNPNEAQVQGLSRKHRLTVYDAVYLELAQRESLPLATLDDELANAARRENVRVLNGAAR